MVCPNCREETRVPTMEDVNAAIQAQAAAAPPREEVPREEVPHEPAAPAPPRKPTPERPAPVSPSVPSPTVRDETWATSSNPWAGAAPNPWIDAAADAEAGLTLKRRKADESRPDMTPMADIVFLLLTFFMLTASFTMQKSMPTDPPEPDEGAVSSRAVAVDRSEDETIIVGISEEDILTLDGEPVASVAVLTESLRAKLAQTGGKAELTIEADPRCSFGMMVGVMDAGISVGMQRIRRLPRGGSA